MASRARNLAKLERGEITKEQFRRRMRAARGRWRKEERERRERLAELLLLPRSERKKILEARRPWIRNER